MSAHEVTVPSASHLSVTESECNEYSEKRADGLCSNSQMIKVVHEFVKSEGDTQVVTDIETFKAKTKSEGAKIIESAANLMGCRSESCVISHPDISKKISKSTIEARFKPSGPRSSTSLLSNFNIDDALQRWSRTFTSFYPFPFTPMDFYRIESDLVNVNITDILSGDIDFQCGDEYIQRKNNQMACVINTDTSTGPGKHWVALFIDCKPQQAHEPWTIEYFNSAGNPPPKDVIRFMEETKKTLIGYRGNYEVDTVNVTKLCHQQSETECGMYVLFYIRCRLEGYSYRSFMRKIILDHEVTAFRKYVFREY